MGIRWSKPPVLLHDVIDDLDAVTRLLVSQAPYTPLGGWFSPGADPHARTRTMWFQNDWVHDAFAAEGSEIFLWHPRYVEAAREFYGAEVVEPQSVYVNLMAAIAQGGPAHTDNPRFHGRDRTNTPMWVLRVMLWSGLFDAFEIVQATAIWWMNDVDVGGGLLYWPNGPDQPPVEHSGSMANTALFGDNHGMFHQVAPTGPFAQGTILVTPGATLAPARVVDGGTGELCVGRQGVGDDWVVTDQEEVRFRAPLDTFRVSVLWKADVYADEAERDRRKATPLSMGDVADTFNDDLARRGNPMRFDPGRVDDAAMKAEMATVYPEATPVGALPSALG